VVVPVINGNLGMEDEAETSGILEVPLGVVDWWKQDDKGVLVNYYSNDSLVFGEQMAISFWINGSGNIITDDYEITVEDTINFSCDTGSFESDEEVESGWNHVVVSVAPAFSKIYVNNDKGKVNDLISVDIIDKNLIMSGDLDDVMLFNKALTKSDVYWLFTYQNK